MADASEPRPVSSSVPTSAEEGGRRHADDEGGRRYADEGESGGSFVVGLLAGTVLGAGLAMIFAPKGSLSSVGLRADASLSFSQAERPAADPAHPAPPHEQKPGDRFSSVEPAGDEPTERPMTQQGYRN